MNSPEITEGNKLIAIFDGLECRSVMGSGFLYFRVPNYYPFCQMDDEENTGWTETTADELDYHTRFDWLVPVIAKINKFDIMAADIPSGAESTFYVLKKYLANDLIDGDIAGCHLMVVRIVKFINGLKGQQIAT